MRAVDIVERLPFGQPSFQIDDGRGMPIDRFTNTFTLGSGDERIDLYHFGRAHTNGDVCVVVQTLSVMHASDVSVFDGPMQE